MKAINLTSREIIADNVSVVEGLFARMKGLLGTRVMPPGTALVIRPCKGVHTFGMRFPIDVIFLDGNKRVIAIAEDLAPNRMSGIYLRAVIAMETPAGVISLSRTRIGDEIELA